VASCRIRARPLVAAPHTCAFRASISTTRSPSSGGASGLPMPHPPFLGYKIHQTTKGSENATSRGAHSPPSSHPTTSPKPPETTTSQPSRAGPKSKLPKQPGAQVSQLRHSNSSRRRHRCPGFGHPACPRTPQLPPHLQNHDLLSKHIIQATTNPRPHTGDFFSREYSNTLTQIFSLFRQPNLHLDSLAYQPESEPPPCASMSLSISSPSTSTSSTHASSTGRASTGQAMLPRSSVV